VKQINMTVKVNSDILVLHLQRSIGLLFCILNFVFFTPAIYINPSSHQQCLPQTMATLTAQELPRSFGVDSKPANAAQIPD
jgi:hypothetical protein